MEKGKGKEEVAVGVAGNEVAVEEAVAEAEALAAEAEVVANSVEEMESGVSEVPDSVTTGDDAMEMDDGMAGLKDRLSDEDVVVDGKIVPLKGYTPVASGERVRRVEASPLRAPLAMWVEEEEEDIWRVRLAGVGLCLERAFGEPFRVLIGVTGEVVPIDDKGLNLTIYFVCCFVIC